MKRLSCQGQTIVEVILAIGIFTLITVGAVYLVVGGYELNLRGHDRTRAYIIAQEGIDAAESIYNRAWNNLRYSQTGIQINVGNFWEFKGEGTSDSIDNFTRTIAVEPVERDVGGDIVASGGTVDLHTIKITSNVVWDLPIGQQAEVELVSYYSNWPSRDWLETTSAEFNAGTETNVTVTNVSGGEIELTNTPAVANWSEPAILDAYDVPGPSPATGIDVFITNDTAYLVKQAQAAFPEFFIFDVSDPTSPSLLGSLELGVTANSVYVSGNYAYIATASNSQELMVVDISNPASLSINGSYNADSNADANSVFISGTYAYLVTNSNTSGGIDPEFYVLDITTPASPSLASYLEVSGNPNIESVYIHGNYAYAATGSNSAEFIVLDVTNPLSPSAYSIYNLPGNSDATDVFIIDDAAYVTTLDNAGANPEFYILDISNPASISTTGSLNIGASANSVYASDDYAFLATSYTNQEFEAINISTPSSPNLEGYADLNGNGNGIFFSEGLAYLATANFSAEFQIVGAAQSYNWPFDTPGNYNYDSAKIEVTGGTAALKMGGTPASGNTLNSAFTSNAANWTYNDWGQDWYDPDATGSWTGASGNPPGSVDVNIPASVIFASDVGGYWEQSFNVTATSLTSADVNFDYQVTSYSPTPITFQVYAFVDSSLGAPVIGNQVWASGEITSTTGWISIPTVDVSSKITGPGTYYLKLAVWTQTGFFSFDGPYTVLFDNAVLNWSGTIGSYPTDRPTINPVSSFNVSNLIAWVGFEEIATKNGGEIYYQLSYDDGATWYYWNGSSWAAAGATNYNTASIINTNISSFPTTNNKIMFKAFLESDGNQLVILDNAKIKYVGTGGGGGYATSGTFTSIAFDTAGFSNFNIIFWNEISYVAGDIEVQLKTADSEANLATAEWSGPEGKDGDETDFFVVPGGTLIHVDHNGDRWMQYKLFFTGDGAGTPVLEDITINYTPW